MAMTPPSSPQSVVLDANVVIALAAKEAGKYPKALAQMHQYAAGGCSFYAPGVLVAESLYALCRQAAAGFLTPAAHATALQVLDGYLQSILPPPGGDAALAMRAEQIRGSYGCTHSADGLYIALAELLAQTGTVELITFDVDLQRQAAVQAPA